jgi:hypothetical protein
MVPTSADQWVRILEATPEQATSALAFLRATLAEWAAQRPFADEVVARLMSGEAVTAAEYANAFHIAEMLEFTSTRLARLYSGIMHSMPVYRLYPAVSEAEAIDLWWPWGRDPLVTGAPAKPGAVGGSKATVLDPSIITATKPSEVIAEVMAKLGVNRVLAGRLSKNIRAGMQQERKNEAYRLLRRGVSRTEVAQAVGLSPSRLGAMFKGQKFKQKKAVTLVGKPEQVEQVIRMADVYNVKPRAARKAC